MRGRGLSIEQPLQVCFLRAPLKGLAFGESVLRRVWPPTRLARAGTAAALLSLVLAPAAVARDEAGGRVALVVGVARYDGFPLKNSVHDADLVASELRKLGFNVQELQDPTQGQITQALTTFKKAARSADAAILYFSGHGMETGGVNYLLPRDAKFTAEALTPSTIAAARFRGGVESAQAVRLVILDACRNNPLGGAGGGLARESAGSSSEVVTLMAAGPGQVASDGDVSSNGPFALALVAALSRPGMTVGELPRYVQSEVQRLTGQSQTPDLQGIWRDLNWSFTAGPGSVSGVSSDLEDRRRAEVAFWEGVRDSSDPEDFRTYLAEVDSGRFTGVFRALSLQRLKKLGAATAPPSAVAAADPMTVARLALSRGAYGDAAAAWRAAAAKGDAAAMSNLGLAAVNGYGAPIDLSAAAGWFKRSAERGNAAGMTNYAALLLNGAGVPKDQKAGLAWLRKAALAGSPSAMEAIGEIYARGERMPRDPGQAALWMQRAVEAGDGPAITDLAYWYEEGLNVARDPARALQLYDRAALAGRAAAMVRLGQIYETGDLAPLDLVQAATWYQRGAEVGDAEASRRLAEMYESGRGVRQNRAAAVSCYRSAAKAGDVPAREALRRLGVAG